jgi:hypothetical protein
MKRLLTMFLVLGLTFGSVTTVEAQRAHRRRVARTVEYAYEGPFVTQTTGCESYGRTWGCGTIKTRSTEAFLTAKVSDAHGQPVFVEVMTRYGDSVGTFCGKTTDPIRFERGADLFFYIGADWVTPLDCPAQRISTTGVISFTLSNRP